MKAEIEQERSYSGKLRPHSYEITLSDGDRLHYLRLTDEELDAITEAWLTLGDKAVRRIVETRRTGSEQGALL